MGIIAWIILGLVAGFIASKIVHHHGQGLVIDIVLGVVGALVGGFLFHVIGGYGITGFNVWSLLVAVAGAVVLLLVWNVVSGHLHQGRMVGAR
jgi:uncharacterized membrane protein YeaQ/YmgE (transglycosylase-associated protein family)